MATIHKPAVYQRLHDEIKTHRPDARGFCGPLAIAAVTGIDTLRVLNYCEQYRVSSENFGMTGDKILRVVRDLGGCSVFDLTSVYKDTIKTPISAERHLKTGKYLLFTNNHVLALMDGQVQDWTKGRRHRVRMVYQITK